MAKSTEKKTNKKKILKPRYAFFMWLTRIILFPIIKFKYRAKIKKFNGLKGRNFVILFNHQTPFDQFFVLSAFKGAIRLLSTEDVVSNGKISHLLKYAYGIVPIKKHTTDVKAVMECIKIAESGGTLAIAPEGNRTYSGETSYIRPAIASLLLMLKLPVVFFTIRGGYGVQPRWSDVRRKGKMSCQVTRVLEYDEYKDMGKGELLDLITSELYVNESSDGEKFYSKKRAEKLERVLYVCPHCGFSEFKSEKNKVYCTKCNREAVYGEDKTFSGDFPFKAVLEWCKFQEDYIVKTDFTALGEKAIFNDSAKVLEVIPYVKKVPIYKRAKIRLFGDKMTITGDGKELVLTFDKISAATVLGRNKLNVYTIDKVYQLKGDSSFNALKYMHFYNVYSQKLEGKTGDFIFGI